MKTTIETITPAIAESYLEKAGPNRLVRKSRVSQFVDIILDGKFQTTHQGIAFDELGRLRDGQHRLHAVVLAGLITPGIAVKMQVTYGISDEAFFGIDMGAKRLMADVISPGVQGARDICEMATSAYRLCRPSHRKADPFIINGILASHGDKFRAVLDHCGTKKRNMTVAPIRLAAAHSFALHGAYSLISYSDLVHGNMQTSSAAVRALFVQLSDIKRNTGRGVGTSREIDLYCRGMVAFDPEKAAASKILIKDTKRFVDDLQKWTFAA